jgi:hypothetical protein
MNVRSISQQNQLVAAGRIFFFQYGICNPDLCLYGIDRVAKEMLDGQVLLEPLEEEFDLPAVFVDCGNRQCWHVVKIGEKYQMLSSLRISKRHAAQPLRVAELGLRRGQQDRLIGPQPGCGIDLSGSNPGRAQIVLGANHKADLLTVQGKESFEIQVTPIDHQNRASRQADGIEQTNIVHFASGNADEHRDGAAQIYAHMDFDSSLGLPEMRPWEQRQAPIDGGRVHCEDWPLEPQAEIFVSIQGQGRDDQTLPERFEQPIVSALCGIGQRRAGDRVAKPNVIELGSLSVQTCHQISQPRPARELRISQANEMAPSGERRHPLVGLVDIDQMFEMAERNELQQLRKNCLALVHDRASSARKTGDDRADLHRAISNRRNRSSAGKAFQKRLRAC